MGQAKITGTLYDGDGNPLLPDPTIGKYNIELVKDPGKSVKRLEAIAKRLEELTPLLIVAEDAYTSEQAKLDTAYENLNAAIIAKTDTKTVQSAVVTAINEVTKKKQAWDKLKNEKLNLEREQARLNTAMATETKAGVWCIDLTSDLAVGQTVGTAEINGEDTQILIVPGGVVADSWGKLQQVGVSTPSATFFNRAIFPGWQKWLPTYRVGTIIDIDYDNNTCDVALDGAYSREQGLNINQAGEAYQILKTAIAGWDAFCTANPTFPLVSNTSDSTITMTEQLKADLLSVNNDVNNLHTYALDTVTYGKLENWTTMSDGASGDCEDFALTKAQKLLDLGYPASAIHVEIGLTKAGVGHAWLIVQTDKGDYALDLGYDEPVLAGLLPYTNRQRQTGAEWFSMGIILRDTAIDYMGGTDSALFFPRNVVGETVIYAGDRVVVEFQEQDWAQPLVIGFESNPRATNVNFFIGKTTSPFSEYARATISARCLRYFGTGPNANLDDLMNDYIQTLILPCPVRVLTPDELTKIQAFRVAGGRVAIFLGTNRTVANDVLIQLNSKLEFMPTFYTTAIKTLSGWYVEEGETAQTLFWIPARVRGWINVKQSEWPTAVLNDFNGMGIKYDDVCAMMYMSYWQATEGGYPHPAHYCQELYDAIVASPSDFTIQWYDYRTSCYPSGYIGTYPTDKPTIAAWLLANMAKMPTYKVAPYNYVRDTIYTPYGNPWDWSDPDMIADLEPMGMILGYAKNENLVVAALDWAYLTDDVGDPVTLDYWWWTQEFANWLVGGQMPIHDFYQNNCTMEIFPPWAPLYYSYSGYVDGTGAVIQYP